jgi:hypothetical protein
MPVVANSRASGTIEHSLKELGAGRSIVIDKHGQIIARNGVIENASKAGITEVDVIQSVGTKIIANSHPKIAQSTKSSSLIAPM